MAQLKQQLIDYAKQQEPCEMCGFVISVNGKNQFYPCENISSKPESYFEISPEEWIKAEHFGEIVAVVHSHPDGEPTLSSADRKMQLLTQVDWWLVCDDEVMVFPNILPLLGREFKHGDVDCYTLFRDFYQLAGFTMPNFSRSDDWWEKGEDLYLDNMAKQGFERIDDIHQLQLGDVILMQVGANVANHAGIYLGNQLVLHHSPKRLSKRDVYDGYWLKHTHSIWRFKEWSRLDFTVPLSSLGQHFN
ncbi:phage tail protein [Pasteurellaceae bacterium Pebbles2]|nr:phage tail protein [Pasteurellaceae bacterium Pebbles2]